MKLISFDIGIKNMAYCVFVLDTSLSQMVVVQDWKVINIMNTIESHPNPIPVPVPICICPLKSKSKLKNKKEESNDSSVVCGRKATLEKNGTYYCAKHAKELADASSTTDHLHILPDPSFSPTSLKKMSKEALLGLCTTWSILDVQHLNKPDLLKSVIQWFDHRCFRAILAKKTVSAKETDLITLGRNMKTHLQSIAELEGATHVIMENQISPLAGRMKTIQGMLAQYYIMQNPSPYIEFISSMNKLKDFAKPLENVVVNCPTDRQIYTKHKTDGVAICREILKINPELGSWTLDSSSKKDDLADCFLQGIWYLKHRKYIMCAENLKINLV
jgi:Mitochondrial resolvase Ydc2 / RNA splicing MRS1